MVCLQSVQQQKFCMYVILSYSGSLYFLKDSMLILRKNSRFFLTAHPFLNIYHLLSHTYNDAWYAFYPWDLLLPCILSILSEEVTDNVENKDEIYNKLSNSSLGY